jgi:hypothetical protein
LFVEGWGSRGSGDVQHDSRVGGWVSGRERKKEKIHLVSLLSFEGKEKDDEEYAEAEPRRIDAADPDTDDEENPKRHTTDAEEDERRQGEREEEERLWGDFVRGIFLGLRLPKRKRLD